MLLRFWIPIREFEVRSGGFAELHALSVVTTAFGVFTLQ